MALSFWFAVSLCVASNTSADAMLIRTARYSRLRFSEVHYWPSRTARSQSTSQEMRPSGEPLGVKGGA